MKNFTNSFKVYAKRGSVPFSKQDINKGRIGKGKKIRSENLERFSRISKNRENLTRKSEKNFLAVCIVKFIYLLDYFISFRFLRRKNSVYFFLHTIQVTRIRDSWRK